MVLPKITAINILTTKIITSDTKICQWFCENEEKTVVQRHNFTEKMKIIQ